MSNDSIDELKLVQDIITTQEGLCFKIFGWAIGLITALTVGFFHKSVELGIVPYALCGTVIILGFFGFARYTGLHFIKQSSAREILKKA